MIHLGDKITRRIAIYDASRGPAAVMTDVEATVIYIHPERRFYTIECKMPGGRSFRETLYFYPRCGMEGAQ